MVFVTVVLSEWWGVLPSTGQSLALHLPLLTVQFNMMVLPMGARLTGWIGFLDTTPLAYGWCTHNNMRMMSHGWCIDHGDGTQMSHSLYTNDINVTAVMFCSQDAAHRLTGRVTISRDTGGGIGKLLCFDKTDLAFGSCWTSTSRTLVWHCPCISGQNTQLCSVCLTLRIGE